jgi:hypothetical protein
MDDDLTLTLIGRQVAFDLLLRGLYARILAAQPGDPQALLVTEIESIIGSMDAVDERPKSAGEVRIWERAEVELRQFMANVALRLTKLADPPG